MPTGPPGADHDTGILAWLTRQGGHGRTGSPQGGGRYGLLLLVLIATYLFSAFNGKNLATGTQLGLFSLILLLAIRSSPLPGRWPLVLGRRHRGRLGRRVRGDADRHLGRQARRTCGRPCCCCRRRSWYLRRVLARPSVTIQSIYGALSAYLIVGLMFTAGYAAIKHLGESVFFAHGQPANTQTFQYFSFTTLTTLGYGDFTATPERRPGHRRPGGPDRPGVPGHSGGPPGLGVPGPGRGARDRD